ncbi:Glutamate-1-semialdehyde 2,1-aminomutase [Symmachiella macrocystis]|uniref:Glutamate-1-semialdehyde 2,1-aminomutase n=1 Tax=Symmachiella macrocystis TaxID=2527985 RepID=A0A5C6BA34_9PLAN|nr:aminotransferase class III-fold pyridoxal phosphate-dependent enzyme [Symmachiella macrocystis]TWU07374.1 Glutamate-1-semialdehyde 2,1-aminomutase [Symmachiella macrocystis]
MTTVAPATDKFVSEFSISRWCDTADVLARLDALLKQPIRPIRAENMPQVLSYFDSHCRQSKLVSTAAEHVIPGGVQHNLAFNYPHPLAIGAADGAHMRDVDGNRYIDFLQAGGATLLGANYRPVRERVQAVLEECGPVTGLLHEYEVKLAELVCRHVPSVEMFRMLGSGTEAVMAAIRLARAHTGRKWIIKMGGGYHGWSDQMVYGIRVPGTGRMDAAGIPRSSTARIQESFPHDLHALRRRLQLNRLRGGTAAVIVEPFGPESGTRPVTAEFNGELRALCDEFGVLLIFDEVVTGFRTGLAGAQGYFDVRPDLTVFGKCLTGGYPMSGGVGGPRDIMMNLAGGLGGSQKKVLVGGTLSANPLSCVAGYYSILEMEKTQAAQHAGRAGDRLCAGLTEIIDRLGLPYVAYNQGSIVHLQTSGVMLMDARNPFKLMKLVQEAEARKRSMEEFGAAYCAHGLITLAGSRLYTSLADTDEVIDEALNRFEDVLKLA